LIGADAYGFYISTNEYNLGPKTIVVGDRPLRFTTLSMSAMGNYVNTWVSS